MFLPSKSKILVLGTKNLIRAITESCLGAVNDGGKAEFEAEILEREERMHRGSDDVKSSYDVLCMM